MMMVMMNCCFMSHALTIVDVDIFSVDDTKTRNNRLAHDCLQFKLKDIEQYIKFTLRARVRKSTSSQPQFG